MKKFVMGLVLGVGLTIAVSAAAEEIQSLIGKQVEGQVAVVVDGVQINVPAAIIDSTSYAPVRAVAEAFGKGVDWKEGKVLIASKYGGEGVIKTGDNNPAEIMIKINEIGIQNEPYWRTIFEYENPNISGVQKITEDQYKEAKRVFEENLQKIKLLNEQLKALLGN